VGVERVLVRGLEWGALDLLRDVSRGKTHVQLVLSALESFRLAPSLRV